MLACTERKSRVDRWFQNRIEGSLWNTWRAKRYKPGPVRLHIPSRCTYVYAILECTKINLRKYYNISILIRITKLLYSRCIQT